MTEYIVPFYDEESNDCFIEKFVANSIHDCEDKIMNYLSTEFELEEDNSLSDNYRVYKKQIDELYGIHIGNITDIESL